jgi:hypothetical protein
MNIYAVIHYPHKKIIKVYADKQLAQNFSDNENNTLRSKFGNHVDNFYAVEKHVLIRKNMKLSPKKLNSPPLD